MQEIVPVVLGCWVFVSIVVFWLRPGTEAAVLMLIGGWLILPVTTYPQAVFLRPPGTGGSMHALALPTILLANKAIAVSLGCLAGMLLTAWPTIRNVRFCLLDLPMALWCLTPIASTLANGLAFSWGLSQSRYLALAWGVPYLVGRVYFGDNDSLVKFGRGWVVAGLISIPFCLIEFLAQPFFYGMIYGAHPYQIEGAGRPFFYRPMLFFEHGNQFGMWIATTAIAAVWLRQAGRLTEVAGIPGHLVAYPLVGVCLISQSHGGIALLLAVLAGVWLLSRPSRKLNSWRIGAGLAIASRAVFPPQAEAQGAGALGESVRGAFAGAGKQSFNWRLGRYRDLFMRALEHPLFGRGLMDWSPAVGGAFVNPVNLGLWVVVLGAYGIVGLIASTLSLVLPIVEVVKWLPPRSWRNASCAGVTLSAVLLTINVIDSLFNSVFLLPLLAGAGGLVTWSQRRFEV